jgi:flagellar biosynthetic protein FliR
MNDPLALAALGILLVRPGVLVVATPVFGGAFVPAPVRVALTVVLGVLLMPAVPVTAPPSPAAAAVLVAGEAVIGLALSMSLRVLVAGAELAGHVAGFQIGISYAAIVDPMTGARNNVLSMLYGSLATITFLGVNGHHAMLRVLADSYAALPPGSWHLASSTVPAAARLLGVVFTLGVQLAMPLVIVLLMVEIVLGLVSRVAPALNLMVIGFPIRLGIGLLTLAVVIQVVPSAVVRYAPAAFEAATRLAWSPR